MIVPFPGWVFRRHGKAAIWADPKLLADVDPDLLANPDRLFGLADCEIIKDQLKIKIGRVSLTLDGVVTGVYVKRYNAFSMRYQLGSLALVSGARRSLRGAAVLSRAGLCTAKPLAAVELRSGGMLEASFFLAEEIAGADTADAYWQSRLAPIRGVDGFRRRRRFLIALAELFSRLHRLGVYHNDLKDANILVAERGGHEAFFLLDLEGVRSFRYLTRRRRVKNLVQINRTLGNFSSRTAKVYFLKAYLTQEWGDKSAHIEWVSDILRATARAERRSVAKALLGQQAGYDK